MVTGRMKAFVIHEIMGKLLIEETYKVMAQLFRYFFVGGMAFIVDYGTLYVLTERVGFHHLLSAAIAFALGLTVISIKYIMGIQQKGLKPY